MTPSTGTLCDSFPASREVPKSAKRSGVPDGWKGRDKFKINKKTGEISLNQKDEPKRLEVASTISMATAAAFVASLLHVYGLTLALGRPVQQFFEPLDYVAISPVWIIQVLLGVLVGLGFHAVTLRAQNFESDEAIAKRAPNPKRSWAFRVLPWKISEVMFGIFCVPAVALLLFPTLRQSISPQLLSLLE
jgi:hypothetical protein